MGANGLTNQKQRGKGDIGGKDLPDGGLEGGLEGLQLENSLPDTPKSDLNAGYCDYGAIDAKSDPAMQKPGKNNKRSRI